ncbi:hypothetical protein SUGI_0883820 [Cryptomeria japonica]|nr:hypothetical protein SUGI_0883820 [Cryptomeria japonica]
MVSQRRPAEIRSMENRVRVRETKHANIWLRIKEDHRHFRFCIVSNISNLKFINTEHDCNIQSIAEQA